MPRPTPSTMFAQPSARIRPGLPAIASESVCSTGTRRPSHGQACGSRTSADAISAP